MANATKRLIAQALEELLSTKTLDKITVKEIVEKSGVNRQTFYYNFEDIYALVEWIFDEKTRQLLEDDHIRDNWKETLVEVFHSLQSQKPLILNTYHSLNRVYLERYLKKWLHPHIQHVVDEAAKNYRVTTQERDFICDCYVAIFVGIALDWVENNMDSDYASQMELFLKLVDGSLDSTLQKFSDTNPSATGR